MALLGFQAFADQGRDHVRSLQVEVVARAIQVDGQRVDGVEAILGAVSLGLDEQHLLCQAVGGVGLLRVAFPQMFFLEGQGGDLGVGADRAHRDELFHPGFPGFVEQLDAHHQVDVEKIGRASAVGADAAGQGGQVDDQIGARIIQHTADIFQLDQIIVLNPGYKHFLCAKLAQLLDHKGTQKTSPTGNCHAPVLPKICVRASRHASADIGWCEITHPVYFASIRKKSLAPRTSITGISAPLSNAALFATIFTPCSRQVSRQISAISPSPSIITA